MDQWGPYFPADNFLEPQENYSDHPDSRPGNFSLESAFSGLRLNGGDHHQLQSPSPAGVLVDPTTFYYMGYGAHNAGLPRSHSNGFSGPHHHHHTQNLNVVGNYTLGLPRFLQLTKQPFVDRNLNSFYGPKNYQELQSVGGGGGQNFNMRGKVVSLAKDGQGSKMLQAKLENGSKEEIEEILREVMECVGDVMKNQSGSYVIQKLFVVCNEEQRTSIIHSITRTRPLFIGICINPHGARAMQKLLENLSTPQQTSLIISALIPVAVALANDQSGHHVIQYCVKTFSIEYTRHLLNEIANNCFVIATQKSGCCVLQSCVEFSHGELRDRLITQILTNAVHLSEDQYGNYVVQHLVGLKLPRVTESLLERLQGNFATLSCNKYASNVVEKIILESGEVNSTRIITELLRSPNASMLLVDPFGNFVIQTALQVSKGQVFNALFKLIYMNSASMQSNIYGKKILDRLFSKKEPLHSVRLYKGGRYS